MTNRNTRESDRIAVCSLKNRKSYKKYDTTIRMGTSAGVWQG